MSQESAVLSGCALSKYREAELFVQGPGSLTAYEGTDKMRWWRAVSSVG